MSSNSPSPNTLSESQLLRRPSPSPTPQEEQDPSPDASTPSPPSPSSPGPDLPLSMSTSTLLTSALPSDARAALAQVSSTLDPPTHKITVRFQAIGDAPPLKVKVAKVSASHTFATVVRFLRKRLYGGTGGGEGAGKEGDGSDKKAGGGESLFCYVNSVFAPGLDEGVGNLWRCFKVDDQLIVAYSRTPAFG